MDWIKEVTNRSKVIGTGCDKVRALNFYLNSASKSDQII